MEVHGGIDEIYFATAEEMQGFVKVFTDTNGGQGATLDELIADTGKALVARG